MHLTAETAADIAKVTTATMRTWCREGKVYATKKNGEWRIDQNALEEKLVTEDDSTDEDYTPAERKFLDQIVWLWDGYLDGVTVGDTIIHREDLATIINDKRNNIDTWEDGRPTIAGWIQIGTIINNP